MANFTYNAFMQLKTTDVPAGVSVNEQLNGTMEEFFNEPVPSGAFNVLAEIGEIQAPCWIMIKADQPFQIKYDSAAASVFTVYEMMLKVATASPAPVLSIVFANPANLQLLAVQ